MNHIRADVPLRPLLIMHGSKDRVVPFAQSVLLHDALRAAGQPVELCQIAGADHNDAAFFQDDVFDIVDAFIRAA
jgi:dipeptidyl aminopeptidase/acylaminoacyl peptidase